MKVSELDSIIYNWAIKILTDTEIVFGNQDIEKKQTHAIITLDSIQETQNKEDIILVKIDNGIADIIKKRDCIAYYNIYLQGNDAFDKAMELRYSLSNNKEITTYFYNNNIGFIGSDQINTNSVFYGKKYYYEAATFNFRFLVAMIKNDKINFIEKIQGE